MIAPSIPRPSVGRTITEVSDTQGPRRIDLADHLHIPAVDGDTGAVTVLLGLGGEEHHEVRLAVGADTNAPAVLDHAIEVLTACRAALDRCVCGATGPHSPARYIGPGAQDIDSTLRTCPGDTEAVATR